jgi:hypothetical protein
MTTDAHMAQATIGRSERRKIASLAMTRESGKLRRSARWPDADPAPRKSHRPPEA